MAETVSVRISEEDLKKIKQISKYEEISVGKAAELAEIPLTKFMNILVERNITFHYSIEDLEEDFKDDF